MAENDQEKTEHLSQKKLEESKEKGELPKSQELGTFVVFAGLLTYFGMTRLQMLEGLGLIATDLFRFDTHLGLDRENLDEFMLRPAVRAALLLAPLLGMILVISPLATLLQTGFNVAKDKMNMNFEKLDPAKGLKRIFSLRQVIEGLKSVTKVGLFSWLAWGALDAATPKMAMIATLPLGAQLNTMADIAFSIGIRIVILMAILATLDFGYQWWEFQKKLKMTHQELKDEMKEREGDPMVKQRQRSIAMQRMRDSMMKEIPHASVVVTNPTHYAVALRYDRDKAPAPYVCAKGTQHMARRIREAARAHGVPIVENKPLARTMFRRLKVGQMIPDELFKAVAEILAFVYMMKQGRRRPNSRGGLALPGVSA